MAQSALRALTQQLMQGGPAPAGMASAQTAIQNAAMRPEPKPVGQQMADVLGGVALPLSAVPIVGDITGLGADAAMYANYPEERTALNYGLTLAGVLPFVPSAAGIRTAGEAVPAALQGGYKVDTLPSGNYLAHGENDLFWVVPMGDKFQISWSPQSHLSKSKPFVVEGSSIDEVVGLADVRLGNSFKALKGKAKYDSIPRHWKGESRTIAKRLIDAGMDVNFSGSTQSKSKYIEVNGKKVRLSDHALPSAYDAPDIDYRYGGDIDALISRVKSASPALDTTQLTPR
jgi:hypothetical protein